MKDPGWYGLLGGLIGTTAGGLTWLVVLGIAIGSLLHILLPLVGMVVGVTLGLWLYSRFPGNWGIAFGGSLCWTVSLALLQANLLYDRIPDEFMGQPTNREMLSQSGMNLFLGVFLLVGVILLVGGYLLTRKS